MGLTLLYETDWETAAIYDESGELVAFGEWYSGAILDQPVLGELLRLTGVNCREDPDFTLGATLRDEEPVEERVAQTLAEIARFKENRAEFEEEQDRRNRQQRVSELREQARNLLEQADDLENRYR